MASLAGLCQPPRVSAKPDISDWCQQNPRTEERAQHPLDPTDKRESGVRWSACKDEAVSLCIFDWSLGNTQHIDRSNPQFFRESTWHQWSTLAASCIRANNQDGTIRASCPWLSWVRQWLFWCVSQNLRSQGRPEVSKQRMILRTKIQNSWVKF